MELWAKEYQSEDLVLSYRIKETLHTERSKYQDIAIVDTYQYGRMLLLDSVVQTTEVDEFVYHEMITHVALSAHPNPKKVLVVGGGDGGSIREILKHKSVEQAILVDIDERVVELSKQYLPSISCGFDDPRVTVNIEDGLAYVKRAKNEFDLIIVDSTDPIGPAVGLFAQEFYRDLYAALKEDGMFVAQTEPPWSSKTFLPELHSVLHNIFPIVKLFLANIPTYESGLYSFTICSKKHDPTVIQPGKHVPNAKYYSPEMHKAAFTLPPFVAELVDMK
ncbi:MAG TPA: spermidine synthase [Firmicutes bacterium]|nr:spermidine synthase [Bacillota bacterium]